MKTVAILAVVTLAVPTLVAAQEIPKTLPPGVNVPRVVLMSMGGTIASKATDRMNITNYGGKGLRVEPTEWVGDVPELALVAKVSTEDLREPEAEPGAPAVPGRTYESWYRVAKRLQAIANDPDIAGVVVTHGTNIMAETAWFMDLVVNTKKPIVFVGSQRPWTGISGDGPLNMFNAVRVAASPDAAGKGVLHAMNQNINAARDVMKTSAYRVETFKSPDLGVMGVADPDRVVFYTEPVRRHTYRSEFNIATLPATPEQLPQVEILYAYAGVARLSRRCDGREGVKGIVIDGTGAGSPSGGSDRCDQTSTGEGRRRRRNDAHP